MEMPVLKKIYVGNREVGMKIALHIKAAADKDYMGNQSRCLIHTFCEKYGIDPRTGEPVKKSSASHR